MNFVADASCTLPWVLRDESTAWTDELLNRSQNGDNIYVPAHWALEVTNGILVAQRRKRIPVGQAVPFLRFLWALTIQVQPPLSPSEYLIVFRLSERHGLTLYDAVYLELSQRLNLPLATLDKALIRAAKLDGSPLIT